MAREDDQPVRKVAHEIGGDLAALSLDEIDRRIELLRSEIARLEEARQSKSAHRAAADALFKSP